MSMPYAAMGHPVHVLYVAMGQFLEQRASLSGPYLLHELLSHGKTLVRVPYAPFCFPPLWQGFVINKPPMYWGIYIINNISPYTLIIGSTYCFNFFLFFNPQYERACYNMDQSVTPP